MSNLYSTIIKGTGYECNPFLNKITDQLYRRIEKVKLHLSSFVINPSQRYNMKLTPDSLELIAKIQSANSPTVTATKHTRRTEGHRVNR